MPSWHEGFGLVAWEAVAAGVPLIVSKESGVYEFLDEQFKTGYVEAIKVRGATESPFFMMMILRKWLTQLLAWLKTQTKPENVRRNYAINSAHTLGKRALQKLPITLVGK